MMAPGNVAVKSATPYGRCLSNGCRCSAYKVKPDSEVVCECGCVARRHQIIKPCALCEDCVGFDKIGVDECQNCPHKYDSHYASLTCPNGSAERALSLSDIHRESTQLRTMRQEMLQKMRRDTTNHSPHGGRRPGAGRKRILDTTKQFEIAAVKSVQFASNAVAKRVISEKQLVNVECPATTKKVIDECRRIFGSFVEPRPLPFKVFLFSDSGERLYRTLKGPSFQSGSEIGDEHLQNSRSRHLYYYHPEFDASDMISSDEETDGHETVRKRARTSADGISTRTSSDDVAGVSTRTSSTDEVDAGSMIMMENVPERGCSTITSGRDVGSLIDDSISLASYARRVAVMDSVVPPSNVAVTSRKEEPYDLNETYFPKDICASQLQEIYPNASRSTLEVILNVYESNSARVLDFMQMNFVDGKFSKAGCIEIFHAYSSSRLPSGGGGIFKVNIDRENTGEYSMSEFNAEMKKRLEGKFKRHPDKAHMQLEVTFEDESGVGDGLTKDFVGLMQKHCFGDYFEGDIDHKIPKKTASFQDQHWYTLGLMMGCAIRQKMVAYPGLSIIVKKGIAGKDVGSLEIPVTEVSNYELQLVLDKVLSCNSTATLDESERCILSRAIEDAECFEDCEMDANWLPRKGKEKLVISRIVQSTVVHQRRGSYIYLAKGLKACCYLADFIDVAPEMGPVVMNHYFPSLDNLSLERHLLLQMIQYRADDEAPHHLVPVMEEQFEKFVLRLEEGYDHECSTVRLVEVITGEPFIYPSQRITVMLREMRYASFVSHTCTNQLDVASIFANNESLELFHGALNGWLRENQKKYTCA